LYEVSVVLTYGVHRRRLRRQAARDAQTDEVEGAGRRGATA